MLVELCWAFFKSPFAAEILHKHSPALHLSLVNWNPLHSLSALQARTSIIWWMSTRFFLSLTRASAIDTLTVDWSEEGKRSVKDQSLWTWLSRLRTVDRKWNCMLACVRDHRLEEMEAEKEFLIRKEIKIRWIPGSIVVHRELLHSWVDVSCGDCAVVKSHLVCWRKILDCVKKLIDKLSVIWIQATKLRNVPNHPLHALFQSHRSSF